MRNPRYELKMSSMKNTLSELLTDTSALRSIANSKERKDKINNLHLAIENALDVLNEVKGIDFE